MIDFDSFVQAIQGAINSASDQLVSKNLDVLRRFFVDADSADDLQGSLDDALSAVSGVLASGGRPDLKSLQKAMEACRRAKAALEEEEEDDSGKARNPKSLKPVTVTVQYPEKTDTGVMMRDVTVPLITLVPISMPSISEVKFRTHLEAAVEGDSVQVGFIPKEVESRKRKGKSKEKDKNQNAAESIPDDSFASTLEIVLKPGETPVGMQKLIEGYEKALRAQIPG